MADIEKLGITQGDFQFYKGYFDDMKDAHEKEFEREVDPELMRAFYRGYNKKSNMMENVSDRGRLITLNRIFATTNTLAPSLYPQNPRKLAIPLTDTSPVSGALMTSVQNYYMKSTNQKFENQDAIMNTWFFGIGWKKVGYHAAIEPLIDSPENQLGIMDKISLGTKNILGIEADNQENRSTSEYVRYETLVNTSEDPMNVFIDHKGDLKNFKTIAHRVKRSLHDLTVFGRYDLETIGRIREKFSREKDSRFDDRNVDVDLIEMTIQQRNGIWILTFVDNFPEPLRYEKAAHQGSMPWAPLSFTYEPGVRYPVSHMRVASHMQTRLDDIANLQYEMLAKARSQFVVNKEKFNEGQLINFKKNIIGGIILSKGPITQGDVTPLQSGRIGADIFNTLSLYQQTLTEIMGGTSQRVGGASTNETATQDQIAELGAQVRESGMLDRVRDWMIQQSRLEGEYLKQFSNAELHLQIDPRDYFDPETGQRMEQSQVEFGTPRRPLGLRHYLEGQFDYEVNVNESIKISKPALRKELRELLAELPIINQMLLESGERIDPAEVAKVYGDSYELISTNRFIQKLDPKQQAAIQTRQLLMAGGGMLPQDAVQAKAEEKEGEK